MTENLKETEDSKQADERRAYTDDRRIHPKIVLPENPVREKGIVDWYDAERRFGFIRRAGTGDDVFVHQTAVVEAGRETLIEGEMVYFMVSPASKRDGREVAMLLEFE